MKKIIVIVAALCLTMSMCSCNVIDTPEEIEQAYSRDVTDITKITDVAGLSFYVPDSYLSKVVVDKTNASYIIKNKSFGVMVYKNNITIDSDVDIESKLSELTDSDVEITNVVSSEKDDYKAAITVTKDKHSQSGYCRIVKQEAVIIAISEKKLDTSETIVDSLVDNCSSKSITIDDDHLVGKVNDAIIGSEIKKDQIENDFNLMENNFNTMKNNIGSLEGKAQDKVNAAEITLRNIEQDAQGVKSGYLNSVKAYHSARNSYNITLSNGISFDAEKAEIEALLGVDLKPENWGYYNITNLSSASPIKTIDLGYWDDQVQMLQVNGGDIVDNVGGSSSGFDSFGESESITSSEGFNGTSE